MRECEKENKRYRHIFIPTWTIPGTGLDWTGLGQDYDHNRRRSLVGSYPQLPRMVDKNIRLVDWSAY